MTTTPEDGEARFSIGAAARQAGVGVDVVRAWERRYGALEPRRTETGRRRYTSEQVERLRLLAGATRRGHAISAIACLSENELRALEERWPSDSSDHPPAARERGPEPARQSAGRTVPGDAAMTAVRGFDATALLTVLETGRARVGCERLVDEVVTPLLHEVGELWARGELDEAHEHFLTSTVRTFLGGLTTAVPLDPLAPIVLVATPEGERHELGALLVAWSATIEGWRAIYLGPDLPPAALGATARATGATAVALSLTCASRPSALAELAAVLDQLDGLVVWVGGSGRELLAPLIEGARPLATLGELREELRAG